ncbi:MAG: 2-phospho-L-lactate transferase CofD family protein [Candidatus Brocadiaceae bacterium]|nr:2-phospho-L-lactate transferase CofD family protein [Candidatus Brocadiaceae bacterium]
MKLKEEKRKTDRINVVLFSGGRGTNTITEVFLKHPDISLTLLVNAYDDGLSTGALRKFIPGMLGPSDVRKNVSMLLPTEDRSIRFLKFLLEYRFPNDISFDMAVDCLEAFRQYKQPFIPEMGGGYGNLSLKHAWWIRLFCEAFLAYVLSQKKDGNVFNFENCSIGNIFFSGCYLRNNRDFNEAIDVFNTFCETRGTVLNITNGENYVLVAVKEDGTVLTSEADIVSPQSAVRVDEIFLLKNYLDAPFVEEFRGKTKGEITAALKQVSQFPEINPKAKIALENADVIIYGPGTQNSSLFPSYLTKGVVETILQNTSAEKVFIANIKKDNEIQGESVNSLIERFFYNISRKGTFRSNCNDAVSTYFFQKYDLDNGESSDYLAFHQDHFNFPSEKVKWLDWEIKDGKHAGGQVLDELLGIVQTKRQVKVRPFHHSVSIIVPGLNEEKTVGSVLHQLNLLDFSFSGLGKEIIFVDGGSNDQTLERARSEKGVRVYQLKGAKGRGAALRYGIEKAKGNIIVFFPSDNEYRAEDIYPIVDSIVKGEFHAVFGSRSIKCMNMKKRNLEIYNGNYIAYWISKYGGILLSMLTLTLYNRFFSDPLTSVKGFDAKVLKNLHLCSNGINLDTEIIAKLCRGEIFILEIPVEFFPRTKKEGKKITIFGGLKALFTLILHRITRNP